MRIKSELLWGNSIHDKGRINDLLHKGKLPYGYYLLLCTKQGKIEIISASMQNNRYFQSREYVIFGVAHSKKEAYYIICDIFSQIYVKHMYDSVSDYTRKVLGDVVC